MEGGGCLTVGVAGLVQRGGFGSFSKASDLAESDFFEPDWQRAFWGPRDARVRAVEDRYDPDGLISVHHGVGSDDGFRRVA